MCLAEAFGFGAAAVEAEDISHGRNIREKRRVDAREEGTSNKN